jgi:DNA modification methylase
MKRIEIRRRERVSAAATNTGPLVEKSVDNAIPTFPVRTRQRRPALVCSEPECIAAAPLTSVNVGEVKIGRAPVRTRRRPGGAVYGVTAIEVAAQEASERDCEVRAPAPAQQARPRKLGKLGRPRHYNAAPVVPAHSEAMPLTNRPDESLEVEVTYREIEELKPPKRQLRTHSPKQVEQIESAIRRMGFINPIIVDAELGIVCGVGRYLAAKEIGLSRVPTIMVNHLSDAELRAYAIADNKLVLNDAWDEKLLAVEFKELMVLDLDLPIELTAFDMIEIDNLLHEEPEAEAAPPEPDNGPPVSRFGDLFQLGDHKLLCADSREETSYQMLLGEERARCVNSDNPYNIKISGNVSGLGKVKHEDFVMASGELSREEFTAFLTTVFKLCAAYSVDGSIHFQWMDHRHLREMIDAGDAAYGELKTLVVWDKQVPGMGSFYRNQFELCFIYKVGKAPHRNNFGLGQWGRNRSSIWSYPGANAMRRGRLDDLALHPTVKSLPCTMDLIRDVTHRGEIVLDPFSGAATTIIACEKTGRIGRAIELDPNYVDVGIIRWEQDTGKQAIHVATGLTFTQLALARMDETGGYGGDEPDAGDAEPWEDEGDDEDDTEDDDAGDEGRLG